MMYQSCTFLLVLFGCLISTQDVSARRNKSKPGEDDKIVGGHDTTIQNVPYQAYLLLQKGDQYYQCGGSVINSKYILTAAHCLEGISQAYIRLGSTNANEGGTVYMSTDLRQHPLYNKMTSNYDAGLIKISEGIQMTDSIKKINLPRSGSRVPAGEELLVTGWGTTSENGNTSTNLMAVKVAVVSNSECNTDYRGGITDAMFCAGQQGKDSCQGDSGGPAVSESNGIQKGIVSFGIGCARQGYPGVYTRIADPMVRMWIKRVSGT